MRRLSIFVGLVFSLLSATASRATDHSAYFRPQLWGIQVPGVPGNMTTLAAVEHVAHRHAAIVEWTVDFTGQCPHYLFSRVRRHGSTPMLTWEPWDNRDVDARTYSGARIAQPYYRLQTFLNGNHDVVLRKWARCMASFGRPIILRFAPEMNGSWNSWSESVNKNHQGQFVKVWRHVVRIFRHAGATNVIWLWSPNVVYEGGTPNPQSLRSFYPGNSWVDLAGMDGYNWGTTQSWSAWQRPTEIFGPTIRAIGTFTKKPLFISETASAEDGGDKAEWIRDFFALIHGDRRILGFVWFNRTKETTWRFDSSPQARASFRQGTATFAAHPRKTLRQLKIHNKGR